MGLTLLSNWCFALVFCLSPLCFWHQGAGRDTGGDASVGKESVEGGKNEGATCPRCPDSVRIGDMGEVESRVLLADEQATWMREESPWMYPGECQHLCLPHLRQRILAGCDQRSIRTPGGAMNGGEGGTGVQSQRA